jgi:hypothetical protein
MGLLFLGFNVSSIVFTFVLPLLKDKLTGDMVRNLRVHAN